MKKGIIILLCSANIPKCKHSRLHRKFISLPSNEPKTTHRVCPVRASLIASNQTPGKLDAIRPIPVSTSRKPGNLSAEPGKPPHHGNIGRHQAGKSKRWGIRTLPQSSLKGGLWECPGTHCLAQSGESRWVNLCSTSGGLFSGRPPCEARVETNGAPAVFLPFLESSSFSVFLLATNLEVCGSQIVPSVHWGITMGSTETHSHWRIWDLTCLCLDALHFNRKDREQIFT